MFSLKIRFIIFAFSLFPFFSFAEAVKLQIWWVEREQVDMLRQIDTQLGDIELEIKVLPINELNNEFIKASASGNSVPDVINIDNPFTAWLADKDMLLSLDDRIEKSDIIDMDSFFDGPRNTVTWKDKTYAIPSSTNTIVVFYNKDNFREVGLDPESPPKTWDELYEAAKKLTNPEKNRYGLFYCAMATEEGTFQILPWVQMTGADWNNINQEGTIEALNYLKRFIDEGLTSKDALITSQDPAPFISGQAAMMITGPWALKNVRASGMDWGVALLPINPKYNIHASALGGLNMAIPTKAENPDAAFRLIEAIEQSQDRYWNEIGYLAPRGDVFVENPIEPEVYKVFVEQLKYAKARGPHPEWNKISKALYQMFQDVLMGKITPEKAVERAEKTINRAIK